MIKDFLTILLIIFISLFGIIGVLFLLLLTGNGMGYLLDKSECVAIVAGNVVYDGRCHFISIRSIGENGNSKILTIYNDIWGFKPKAQYVNQDIEVTND